MRITRSSSLRKSIPNYDDTKSSDLQHSSSPTPHQQAIPSPTASISSCSTQSPSTPNQYTFPHGYNSDVLVHHPPQQSSRRVPSACTYPIAETKSTHPLSISRIKNRLSSSGSTTHASKLQPSPLYNQQNRSLIAISQSQVSASTFDHPPYSYPSNLSNNRVRSSTLANTKLSLGSKSSINSLSKSCDQFPKSDRLQQFFGVVKHSFKAEGRYELDVQAGESIIINAYTDQGWFICKPISRLGGPGLVPITHVQICDMSSGKQLSSEETDQFLRSSGLPQAEQWQQAVAAYKCNSIPLGSLDNLSLSAPSTEPSTSNVVPESTVPHTGSDNMTNDFQENVASSELVREWQLHQVAEGPQFHISARVNELYASIHQPDVHHGTFVRSTAESFHEEGGQLLFLIKVQFACPIESETFMKTFIIHRSYKELLAFDVSFRSHLKSISDTCVDQLGLPTLVNQVSTSTTDLPQCFSQFENLKCYLSELSRAPLAIRDLKQVYNFLAPSEIHLDFEIHAKSPCEAIEEEALQRLDETPIVSSPEEYFNLGPSINNRPQSSSACQRNSSPLALVPSLGCRSSDPISECSSNNPPSDYFSPKKPASSAHRFSSNHIKSYYQSDGEYTKIKIYDLQSDDVIAIRVSSNISLKELRAKVAARFRSSCPASNFADDIVPKRRIVLKHLVVDSSDERDANFIDYDLSDDELDIPSPRVPGKLTRFLSDDHLWNWMRTQDRLVLYV